MAAELALLASRAEVQIVDTRLDRKAFLAGHLPGSLYAPFNRTFTTTAGSMIDLASPIVLLIQEAAVDDAVRDLVRIGGDRIVGWAPPAVLNELQRGGTTLARIESIDFGELERRRTAGRIDVLDVRSAAEHAARHIPGASAIAHTRLRQHLDAVPDDGPVYVHCAAGARAAAAAALLARAGRAVVHVDGSFAAWSPEPEAVAR
jgi:hydroxyacylglutathione hydrolase